MSTRTLRLLRRRAPRGFNLVELLIALSITAILMVATMVAIRASFMAYQSTTEVAATNAIARLAMHRMLTLIRTGTDFGPFPADPNDSLLESDYIDIVMPPPSSDTLTLQWVHTTDATHPVADALYTTLNGGTPSLVLGGVIPGAVKPFTLEYLAGRQLYRVTIDLTIVPDDDMSVTLDGINSEQIRLVASTMPRITAYKSQF